MMKILSEIAKQNKFASIFTNCDPASGSFIYGIVLYVDDNYFVIKMYDRSGNFDGFALLSTDKILYIETDGQYHKSMQLLITKSIDDNMHFRIDNNCITCFLDNAMKWQQIVSIELADSGRNNLIGFVFDYDEVNCKIQLIDEYGQEDGFGYCSLADITQICMLSTDEQRVQRIFEARKNR